MAAPIAGACRAEVPSAVNSTEMSSFTVRCSGTALHDFFFAETAIRVPGKDRVPVGAARSVPAWLAGRPRLTTRGHQRVRIRPALVDCLATV